MRAPVILPELALMGRDLDRSKDAGETHDPGHYIDLADDGKAMGIVPIERLQTTLKAYDTPLKTGRST